MVQAERVTRVQKLARLDQVTGQLRAVGRKNPEPRKPSSDQAPPQPTTSNKNLVSQDRKNEDDESNHRRRSSAVDHFKLAPPMMYYMPPPPPPPYWFKQPPPYPYYQLPPPMMMPPPYNYAMYPGGITPPPPHLALPPPPPLQPPPTPPQQYYPLQRLQSEIPPVVEPPPTSKLLVPSATAEHQSPPPPSNFRILSRRMVTTEEGRRPPVSEASPSSVISRRVVSAGNPSAARQSMLGGLPPRLQQSAAESMTTTVSRSSPQVISNTSAQARMQMSLASGASPLLMTSSMAHPQVEYSETESGGEDGEGSSSSGSGSMTVSGASSQVLPETREPPVQPVLEPMPNGIIQRSLDSVHENAAVALPSTIARLPEPREQPTLRYEAPVMRLPVPIVNTPKLIQPPTQVTTLAQQQPRQLAHTTSPAMSPSPQSSLTAPQLRLARGLSPTRQMLIPSPPQQVQREIVQLQQQYIPSTGSYRPPSTIAGDRSSPRPVALAGPEYYGNHGLRLSDIASPRSAYHSMFTQAQHQPHGEMRLSPLAPPASLSEPGAALMSHRAVDLIAKDKQRIEGGEIASSSRFSYSKPRMISKPPVVISGGRGGRSASLRSLTKSGRSEMTFTVERLFSKKRICGC